MKPGTAQSPDPPPATIPRDRGPVDPPVTARPELVEAPGLSAVLSGPAVAAPPGMARRLLASRMSRITLVTLALLAALGALAPVLAPAGPFRTSPDRLAGPSWAHLAGTDDLGRDVLTGMLYGARTSLLVALGVVAIAGLLALVVGSLAGFAGGLVDDVLMRLAELVLVLPRFFLAVAGAALFGSGLVPLVVLLGTVSWPVPARVLRSQVLSRRELPYVEAARAIGARPRRILVRHVIPNSLAPFLVSLSLLAGTTILIEAGLAFLGLGNPETPSWGTMLRDAQPLMRDAPWAVLFPAGAVTAAVLAFNLLGDGLLESWLPGGGTVVGRRRRKRGRRRHPG